MSPAKRKQSDEGAYIKVGACRLRLDRPRVMGIVNITADSFSGDGIPDDFAAAVSRGKAMFEAGADIVDIGGESTRPGADPVPIDLESKRTLGVVEALNQYRPGRVSIDTYKPEIAERALYAGATIVNDVTGLRDDRMIKVVAEQDAAVVIMHMKGEPKTMQARPTYKDVVSEISLFLSDRVEAAERAGIRPKKIMIDPGIGFGKTLHHNLEIIARLREFKALGKPIVIGVSRKAFIGKLTGLPPNQRLEGSIAAAVAAAMNGADVLRVHDVVETVRAMTVVAPIIAQR